jgi:hypothetical protein
MSEKKDDRETAENSSDLSYVWRETLDEGYIGARNYSKDA